MLRSRSDLSVRTENCVSSELEYRLSRVDFSPFLIPPANVKSETRLRAEYHLGELSDFLDIEAVTSWMRREARLCVTDMRPRNAPGVDYALHLVYLPSSPRVVDSRQKRGKSVRVTASLKTTSHVRETAG